MATTHPAQLNGGVWTSWLPLTTAWPTQAACATEAWARFGVQFTIDQWPYIYDPAYAQTVASPATACLPSEVTSWWESGTTVSNTITSYSIGPIVCPAAYTTDYVFARGLHQNTGIDGVCTSTMTPGQSLIYASPQSNSYTSAITTFTEPAIMIAVPVEGYNFAAPTTSSSISSIGSTSSLPSNSSPASSSGLSTGAKAGIGAGIAGLAVVLAALGAFWFFWRRKYQAAPASEPPGYDPDNGGVAPSFGGAVDKYKVAPVEADTNTPRQRWEMDSENSRPVEMQG